MMPPVPVMLDAQSVAMQAKINEVDPQGVETMLTVAEELLPHDAPLYRAITAFATQYMEVKRDPEALAREGEALQRAVELAAHDVSLPYRSDLDG